MASSHELVPLAAVLGSIIIAFVDAYGEHPTILMYIMET